MASVSSLIQMTDQFKEGFLEHLLSTLAKSSMRSEVYRTCIKINGDRHWLKVDCRHWTVAPYQKVEELFAFVSIKKYNTFHWMYRSDKSYDVRACDELGDLTHAIKFTTTQELNKCITTFTYCPIIKNPWLIYSKVECTVCKEDKEYIEFEELKTCSHSFCISCLDAIVKLPHTQHKCPICRESFKDTEEEDDNDDDDDG